MISEMNFLHAFYIPSWVTLIEVYTDRSDLFTCYLSCIKVFISEARRTERLPTTVA